MRTEDLINALVADLTVSKVRFRQILAGAIVLGSIIAAAAFLFWIGVRPDIGQALETSRFLFKFVITLTLAATAAGLLSRLATPGVSPGFWVWACMAAPILLVVAEVAELIVTPAPTWWPRLVGTNARFCLTLIPLLSIGPLACILLALRQGAPTNPGLAGAVAGLVASGIAATLYASHCTDDSPLFVATWYSLATGIVVLVGCVIGSRILRW
jgi:hypothetical protein